MRDPEAATLDDAAEIRAALIAALKLLAEMQCNRSIAPAYKRDVDRILSSMAAMSVLDAAKRQEQSARSKHLL